MLNLLRNYAITSFVGVIVAAVLLTGLYQHREYELMTATSGIAAVMLVLYLALLVTVLQASKVIEKQQANTRERTEALQTLSAQLLKNQETERELLADGLHEDLAQTLSAIKLRIEDSLNPRSVNDSTNEALRSAASALQGVIEELQQRAMELRPPSLNELGLLPTIQWFCREFEFLHAGIRVEREISLHENQIPGELRIVIYRIIEAVFGEIGRVANTDRIQLALRLTADAVMLAIEYTPYSSNIAVAASQSDTADPRQRFVVAQERTTQSGGTFLTAKSIEGRIALQAYWPDSLEFTLSHTRRRNELAETAGAAHPELGLLPGAAEHMRPEAA